MIIHCITKMKTPGLAVTQSRGVSSCWKDDSSDKANCISDAVVSR